MPLSRRSLFKGALGAAVLATALGVPSPRPDQPERSREATIRRIRSWLIKQHTDRECVAILVALNALLLERHPDVANPHRMMASAMEIRNGVMLVAQEPRRLATRITYEPGVTYRTIAPGNDSTGLCRGFRCRLHEVVDSIADELRAWKAVLASQGMETRFFVPIDTPGALVDLSTFQPYFPTQTLFGTVKGRPAKQSGPRTMLVAQAA